MNEKLKYGEEGGMDPEADQSLYARTLYLLRESRKSLLRQYGVDNEDALLERIRNREIEEHPSYEHYLSARIIDQTREQIRAEMIAQMRAGDDVAVPDISVHAMLKDRVADAYAARLAEAPRMAQDALLLSFDTGLLMEVRYFSASEYAVHWSWGEAVLRIDTAPVHEGLAHFPQHLHRDDGNVDDDALTTPGADVWSNFSGLLDVLLLDPLLEGSASE